MSSEKFTFWEQGKGSKYKIERSTQEILWEKMNTDTTIQLKQAFQEAKSDKIESASGKYVLAIHYLHGWGVNQDYKTSIQLYKEAADKGHAGACYELAKFYLQGHSRANIEKDIDIAEQYTKKGIESNIKNELDTDNYKQQTYVEQLEGLSGVIQALKTIDQASKTSGCINKSRFQV